MSLGGARGAEEKMTACRWHQEVQIVAISMVIEDSHDH
jgi:hypothetical protein